MQSQTPETPRQIREDSSPSTLARVLAFSSIVVAGVCGGLIGYGVTDLSCSDGCTTFAALIGLGAAVVTSAGVAVVAVLVLRATAEWRAADAARSASIVAGAGGLYAMDSASSAIAGNGQDGQGGHADQAGRDKGQGR